MKDRIDLDLTDPDIDFVPWEKIPAGGDIVLKPEDFPPHKQLEVVHENGKSVVTIQKNLRSNSGVETVILAFPTGEKALLVFPDNGKPLSYPFYDFHFELSSDGSFGLKDSDNLGFMYRFENIDFSNTFQQFHSVPAGMDGKIDGHMKGGCPVSVSTQRVLGCSKYSFRNEDNVGFSDDTLVVADGVGSMTASEQASHFAVETLLAHAGELDKAFERTRIFFNFFNYYLERKQCFSDTVLSAVRMKGNGRVDLLSVGDAKWRLIRDGEVVLASRDLSLVQRQFEMGMITEREKFFSIRRGQILTSLGMGEFEMKKDVEVHPGDVIVLFSDGMDSVSDHELAEIVTSYFPHEAVQKLNELVAVRNSNMNDDGLYVYERDFRDGEPPVMVPAPVDNVTVGIIQL